MRRKGWSIPVHVLLLLAVAATAGLGLWRATAATSDDALALAVLTADGDAAEGDGEEQDAGAAWWVLRIAQPSLPDQGICRHTVVPFGPLRAAHIYLRGPPCGSLGALSVA